MKAKIEIEDYTEKEFKDYLLSATDFTAEKRLGSGTSGDVFLATYSGSKFEIGKTVAIKQFSLKKKEHFQFELKNSIFLLGKSPHIVMCHGFYIMDDFRFLIMEAFDCTLAKKIRNTDCILEKHVRLPEKMHFFTSKYILISPFSPTSDNFFYYNKHSNLLNAITINQEQYNALLDLYSSIIYNQKLSGNALEQIEKITDHHPPKIDGLNEAQIKEIILQMSSVLVLFSELQFVHTDLKPANIGLKFLDNGKILIKVFDFDLSFTLAEPKNCAGSPYYMAPEVLIESYKADYTLLKSATRVNSIKSDMYSVGLLMWCLIYGKQENPFFTPDIVSLADLYQHVVINRGNEKLPFPDNTDELFKKLLNEAVSTLPESRPDAASFHERLKFCINNNRIEKNIDAVPVLPQPTFLELEDKAIHIAEQALQRAKEYILLAKKMTPVSKPLMWAIERTLNFADEAFNAAKLAKTADLENNPKMSKMLRTYGIFQAKSIENLHQMKVNHSMGINHSS